MYVFNGFQESDRVDIQAFEDGLKVNVLLFGFGIMAVFGHDDQIAIVPRHHVNIPLKAVGCAETDMVSTKAEGCETIVAAEDGLVASGFHAFHFIHKLTFPRLRFA